MTHSPLYSLSEPLLLVSYESGFAASVLVLRAAGIVKLLEGPDVHTLHQFPLGGSTVVGELSSYGTLLEAAALGRYRGFMTGVDIGLKMTGAVAIWGHELHGLRKLTAQGLQWVPRVLYRFEHKVLKRGPKVRFVVARNTKVKFATRWVEPQTLLDTAYKIVKAGCDDETKRSG